MPHQVCRILFTAFDSSSYLLPSHLDFKKKGYTNMMQFDYVHNSANSLGSLFALSQENIFSSENHEVTQ